MEITDAYRRARRNTSVLCGIGLAWSAAQFELKELNFGSAGSVDISHASVPLMLACGIVYTLIRCIIEYAMQSDDVRRWRLAQIDFKITVFLVRATLLILAASGLYRSVKTIVYIVVAALLLLVITVFLIFVGMLVLTPLMIRIRSHQGRCSVAARVFEALSWSELIIVVLLAAALAVSGVASLRYEPLRSMWTVAPSPFAVAIFVVTAIVMVISIYVQRIWYKKLFAFQDTCIMTKRPDGTIGVSFVDKQKDVIH
jgi:hypothetical protein